MFTLCFDSVGEDEEEEEVAHMGNSIMSFYSALIDLLGRCAPEMHVRAHFCHILLIYQARGKIHSFLHYSAVTLYMASL